MLIAPYALHVTIVIMITSLAIDKEDGGRRKRKRTKWGTGDGETQRGKTWWKVKQSKGKSEGWEGIGGI